MTTREMTAIPYERQSDQETNRGCGAASLSMVYRFYGNDVSQHQIWQAIARKNRFGTLSSTTHLMVRDAQSRGFAAVAFQARHPLQALRICRQSRICAILNHRLRPDVATGHYSVLVDIDDKHVVLHDPLYGPSRRLSNLELLELWQPRFPNCEIAGNVLIGVAARPSLVSGCQFCRTATPSGLECPQCKNPVGLQPAELLGCLNSHCIGRIWNYVCCPSCDYMWALSLRPTDDSPAAPVISTRDRASAADALDVNKLLGDVDKFCNHIRGIPNAANHPEIQKQLDQISTCRDKFVLAYAEQLARSTMLEKRFAELTKQAREQEVAIRQKMEESRKPLPSLNGNALGRALLGNLGFDCLNSRPQS